MSRSFSWKQWRRSVIFSEFYRLVSGRVLFFNGCPRLLKDLWKLQHACVLVVTPLVSIMKDQVEELTCLGLRAFAIGLRDEKGEKELVAGGFDVDLLYGSPETLSLKTVVKTAERRSARKANCLCGCR